jgi:hypothetical protein
MQKVTSYYIFFIKKFRPPVQPAAWYTTKAKNWKKTCTKKTPGPESKVMP